MASSENLAGIEAWTYRPTFSDTWISEADTLTKALQKSFSGGGDSDTCPPFAVTDTTAQTPTVSGLSVSDPETAAAAPKRQRCASLGVTAAGGGNKAASKRKSRASKKSQTTFITADPANFRHMVQQVTGVRLGNSQVPMAPILKPEPQRPGNRLPVGSGCLSLPTLDTSAFLLDHHLQQVVGPSSAGGAVSGGGVTGSAPLSFAHTVGVPDAALDFEAFSSFPTLESWKVM